MQLCWIKFWQDYWLPLWLNSAAILWNHRSWSGNIHRRSIRVSQSLIMTCFFLYVGDILHPWATAIRDFPAQLNTPINIYDSSRCSILCTRFLHHFSLFTLTCATTHIRALCLFTLSFTSPSFPTLFNFLLHPTACCFNSFWFFLIYFLFLFVCPFSALTPARWRHDLRQQVLPVSIIALQWELLLFWLWNQICSKVFDQFNKTQWFKQQKTTVAQASTRSMTDKKPCKRHQHRRRLPRLPSPPSPL